MDTPVQFVKGVGPRLGAVLASREIRTVRELLTFFPRSYEDRSTLVTVSQLQEGVAASVALQVVSSRLIPIRKFGRTLLQVRAADSTGSIGLKWFHVPRGMESRFKVGAHFIATGTPKTFQGGFEINHPEINWGKSADASGPAETAANSENVGRVVPVYTELEGVPTRTFRKILWEAIQKYITQVNEDLPDELLKKHGLPALGKAIRYIHFPESKDFPETSADFSIENLIQFRTPAHSRLVYEEFFKFEYLVLRQKLKMEKQAAPRIGLSGGREAVSELIRAMPFRLTGDQKKTVDEILEDLGKPHPMNRLVQGDVGSGKTAVALLTAGCAIAEGGQVALMAPTEILAEQHYQNCLKLFGSKIRCELLLGKSSASDRAALLPRLAAGEPLILIGTHALLEDPVVFKNLTLVMIDEQHRFGVEQRRTLRKKGANPDPNNPGKWVLPHILVLTATPIPRTLALTAYGDLSVSSIQEMPPGRSPIITKVVRGEARKEALFKIKEQLSQGRQAYFIYPLVKESEAEGFTELKAATVEAERLQKEIFPEFKVGLLHGQMKADEKAKVMADFKSGKSQILVSTTVVEVGVDVPNATIMVIEHAERFGLSQLHQLRGRVGRGTHQSYCFLLAPLRGGELTNQRLEVLEETSDGFRIAEADLEIRGPGEFLGTRQAGGLPFRLANLVRDREWLLKARDDAQELLIQDPDLTSAKHARLRSYFERDGKTQFERLRTS
ncbi:MAG: ATP-dependent DNA helicase RecG [Bdellovibrionales bacterium]|nr:ATP-dependent DNA helicase RecG [Bdellovibrionales bacterium]